MKRKFKEALENFQKLILIPDGLCEFLRPMFYMYRAYGYFCQGSHQKALFDYLVIDNYIQINDEKSCLFN